MKSSHEGVPDSVAIDEPLKFLCSLRTIRDTARKEVSSISQELEFARGVAKYQDMRLSMAKTKLTALEEIIGEMRMRCRMRGLPLYPPHALLPVDPDEEDVDPSSEIADPSGPAITSDSGMMEEVSDD